MEEYQQIKADLTSAEAGLREAERRVEEQRGKLTEWMTRNEKYLKK